MAEEHAHKGHRHGHGEQRSGVAVGVLTCSDRSARGERADIGGPTVHNLVLDRIPGAKVTQYKVVPDDREQISSTLIAWADDERLDLILTTGGTGLAPRDITPEATHAVIDRAVPAFPLAMLFESLRVTPLCHAHPRSRRYPGQDAHRQLARQSQGDPRKSGRHHRSAPPRRADRARRRYARRGRRWTRGARGPR